MATFEKFEQFAVDLAANVHELTTAGSALRVALTDSVIDLAANTVLADFVLVSTNITETLPALVTAVAAENPGGTWSITGTDIVLNATGVVPQFQYVILFNDMPTSPADPLIAMYDYGSKVNMVNGESFTINFGAEIFNIS